MVPANVAPASDLISFFSRFSRLERNKTYNILELQENSASTTEGKEGGNSHAIKQVKRRAFERCNPISAQVQLTVQKHQPR